MRSIVKDLCTSFQMTDPHIRRDKAGSLYSLDILHCRNSKNMKIKDVTPNNTAKTPAAHRRFFNDLHSSPHSTITKKYQFYLIKLLKLLSRGNFKIKKNIECILHLKT